MYADVLHQRMPPEAAPAHRENFPFSGTGILIFMSWRSERIGTLTTDVADTSQQDLFQLHRHSVPGLQQDWETKHYTSPYTTANSILARRWSAWDTDDAGGEGGGGVGGGNT